MKEKVRIAVVGAGYITKLNIAALLDIPEAEICGISNHHPEKAAALIRELGVSCPVYADWNTLLAETKPDVAAIFLPHHIHNEAFLDACRAGVDICIEKPFARDEAESEEMLAAARAAGVRVSLCHTQRYNAAYVAVKKYIAEHPELGRLLSVEDHINYHYFWQGRAPWMLSQEQSGGGILLNYGVHQLDRVHYLMDDMTDEEIEIRPYAEKPGYEIYSAYSMIGTSRGGIQYSIFCAGYNGPSDNGTMLCFENGTIRCVLGGGGLAPEGLFAGSAKTGRYEAVGDLPEQTAQAMYVRQFREAVDYFLGKTDVPPVSMEWGADMVRLVRTGIRRVEDK